MATGVPPLSVYEAALEDILKNLGIAPIVLDNWRISIESGMDIWAYTVTLSWRRYRFMHYINKDDVGSSRTAALFAAGKAIASKLYVFNAAKDEEHMEALMLLSLRPTNESQNQLL